MKTATKVTAFIGYQLQEVLWVSLIAVLLWAVLFLEGSLSSGSCITICSWRILYLEGNLSLGSCITIHSLEVLRF